MFLFVFTAKPTAPRNCTLRPYIVTSASLNSSNQTIVSNQSVGSGSTHIDKESSYHPHMEYLRQNDKGRDKKSFLEDNSRKVKRTTTTISLLEISSMKDRVSNNNITLKSGKFERKKRDGDNNRHPSSLTTPVASSLPVPSLSLTTSQSTIQENYQYISSSSSPGHIEINSSLNSQSKTIQQDNQNNNNNNLNGHGHRQHIRVRKSLLNSNNKQRKINHHINSNSHPSSTTQTQSSTVPSDSAYASSANFAYLKFDNLYNNINENFNHLENYDNIVYSIMELECLAGYDGGLPQQFYLEAYDSKTKKLRLNITSIFNDVPLFRIDLAGNAGFCIWYCSRVGLLTNYRIIFKGFIKLTRVEIARQMTHPNSLYYRIPCHCFHIVSLLSLLWFRICLSFEFNCRCLFCKIVCRISYG